MPKKCDVCGTEIPEDYGNLLCLSCYNKQSAEIEQKKADEKADRDKRMQGAPKELKEAQRASMSDLKPTDRSVPQDYKKNPELEDKPQWEANIVQFAKTGQLLYKPTRTMYEFIKTWCMRIVMEHPQYPKFIWKPTIVDVGCGFGCGSNIMSQEADFVWGLDKNAKSVKFAQEAFTRQKNGVYYNSQVTFDQWDIIKDTRAHMVFDVVVAIEIIEHVSDHDTFLKNIITFAKKKKGTYDVASGPTQFFISTPNRNNRHIREGGPYNKAHVKEWTSGEYLKVLKEYFENVEFFNSAGVPIPPEEYETTTHTPLLARTSLPKI